MEGADGLGYEQGASGGADNLNHFAFLDGWSREE